MQLVILSGGPITLFSFLAGCNEATNTAGDEKYYKNTSQSITQQMLNA